MNALAEHSPARTLAADRRAEAHMGLVGWVVKNKLRIDGRNPDYHDFVMVGMQALVRASRGFDPFHGVAFPVYAITAITRAVWSAATKEWRRGFMGVPDREEVREPVSLFEQTGARGGRPLTVLDTLTAPHEDADSDDPQSAGDRRAAIQRAIGRLPARERFVIERIWWDDLTFREIGAMMGVSRERVRQIELAALRKLERWLGGTGVTA